MVRFAILLSLALGLSVGVSQAAQTMRHRVTGVAANDTLALRERPHWKAKKLRSIPPSATRVYTRGDAARVGPHRWLKVSFDGATGWVNGRYLARMGAKDDVRLSRILDCVGANPYWNLHVDERRLLWRDAAANTRIWRRSVPAAQMPDGAWRLEGLSETARRASLKRVEGTLRDTGACSDGTSKQLYRYELRFSIEGTTLDGCCNRLPQRISAAAPLP